MKTSAEKYISELISRGENQTQDFKFEISDARKIARSLVAFSNTAGGKLLIGVKDNGRIAGVRSEEEYYMIEAAAGIYCRPQVKFSSRRWTVEGKTVLEIDIQPGNEKPYYAQTSEGKWLVYYRNHDQNILASIVQLKVWQNAGKKIGVLIEYRESEEWLLKYLDANESVSVNEFSKLAGISRKKAVEVLTRLVSVKAVKVLASAGQTRFTHA
jgi:predicted HTH transcriptional regulator